jgi:hypothetical protein
LIAITQELVQENMIVYFQLSTLNCWAAQQV